MKKTKDKLYIVKKYIYARSCAEAIRKEKKQPVDDCWMDEDFRKKSMIELPSAVGFAVDKPLEDNE